MSRFFLYSLLWLGCFVLLSRALSIQEQSRQENIEEEEFGHKHPSGTVYVIRHGEKPEDGSRGLSCLGHKRAKCVLSLFGPQSDLDINYIIAAPSSGRVRSSRSIDTAKPLAEALNLEIDSQCASDDAKCVAKRVRKMHRAADKHKGTSINTLIIGRHSKIPKIIKELGIHHPPKMPDIYDVTFKIRDGRLEVSHQHCPGLDDIQTDATNSTTEDEGCEMNENDPNEYTPTQVSFVNQANTEIV